MQTITLTATYSGITAGDVVVTPGASAVVDFDGTTYPTPPRVAHVQPDGTLTVVVPAPDSPGISPAGWQLEVSERFPGGRTFTIAPSLADGTTQPLVDLEVHPALTGGSPVVRGRVGATPVIAATVTTGAAGSPPIVTIGGTPEAPTFAFRLPPATADLPTLDARYSLIPSAVLDLREFGNVGTSLTSDDSAYLDQAYAVATAQGYSIIEIPATRYGVGITGRHPAPTGVLLRGSNSIRRNLGSYPGAAIRCMDAASNIYMGGDINGSSLQGGKFGNLIIDANNVATQPLTLGRISQTDFDAFTVRNTAVSGAPQQVADAFGVLDTANDLAWMRANCAVLVEFLQNSKGIFNLSQLAANGLVIDNGAGGLSLHVEVANYGQSSPGWGVVVGQTIDPNSPLTPYSQPTHVTFYGLGGIERGAVAAGGPINVLAGVKIKFKDQFIVDGIANVPARPTARFRKATSQPTGPIHFHDVIVSGSVAGTGFDIGDGCTVVSDGYNQFRAFAYGLRLGAAASFIETANPSWNPSVAIIDPTSAGTMASNTNHSQWLAASQVTVTKTAADEAAQVTQTTAIVADNRLFTPAALPVGTYRFRSVTWVDSPANNDVTLGWYGSAGISGAWSLVGPAIALAAGATATPVNESSYVAIGSTASTGTDAGKPKEIVCEGSFTLTTPGVFGLRWGAANAVDAVNTSVKAWSTLTVWQTA